MQLNHAILVQVLFGVSDELRLLTGARRKLSLLKLVVTGDGRVGKTSLLRCLRGEPFDQDEPSTCGVELCTVEVGAEKWAATNLAAVERLCRPPCRRVSCAAARFRRCSGRCRFI